MLKTIDEIASAIDELNDEELHLLLGRSVRLKVIASDELRPEVMTEIALKGGAFDWLFDPAEDGIYSDTDGEPV